MDQEIGRGGMAVVHAGWHEQLERPVALKILAEHLSHDEEFRGRFMREARIASKLQHPNLVRTYDIAVVEGRPCIVMELATGGTLEDGSLSREEAGEIAAGLAHAHEQGVVHRDLKPANLLRTAGGEVKIADFGIARALEETVVTQIGTILGTARYLSPEQAEGRVVGTAADVYSLGVVFDELLEGATAQDVELIEQMRSYDPDSRPSAGAVASAFGATLALPRSATGARRQPSPLSTRAKLLAVGAATAIVAAVAIVAAGVGGSHPAGVEPVRHATTPAAQAHNLSAWLKQYSR